MIIEDGKPRERTKWNTRLKREHTVRRFIKMRRSTWLRHVDRMEDGCTEKSKLSCQIRLI